MKNKNKNKKKIKEHMTNFVSGNKMLRFGHFIIILIAIFISTKCNKGINIWHLLSAVIFPEFYLIYIFATRGYKYEKYCPPDP